MTRTVKQEDNWINLIKLCAILIVVLGHYNYVDADWWATELLLYIVKSATSVMFIYSGYYLCKNRTLDEHDKSRKYLGHLATIAVVWIFVYFLRDVGYAEKKIDVINGIFQSTMFDVTRFNSGHFWFIQNLFLAVAVMFIFKKKHFKIWEVILLIALQKYYYWLLICSLASIGIGFILAETEKKFDKKKLFLCLCTGTAAAGILCTFSYGKISLAFFIEDIMIEVMRYLLSISVAVIGLCMDSLVPIHLGIAGHYVRKISTVIYLCHNLFVEFTFKVAAHYGALWGEEKFFVYSAGTAIILSFGTGIVLCVISELKPFRWLKKIY